MPLDFIENTGKRYCEEPKAITFCNDRLFMKGILPLAHISILKLPAMQLKLVFKEKSFASLNELLGCKSFFKGTHWVRSKGMWQMRFHQVELQLNFLKG
jgi:hypothetical protein